LAGLLCCHVLSIFFRMDLTVFCGMFKVSDIFYNQTQICTSPQLCPWPIWRAPWSSWCRLLSAIADSGAFQNRWWGDVTLRLHTGALYLTNYVTSEGNWQQQILFRGSWCRKFTYAWLESLNLVFQPLHKYSFGMSVRTSTLCMTQVIFPAIVYKQIISLKSPYNNYSGSEVYKH
jgi:hypothetical protein